MIGDGKMKVYTQKEFNELPKDEFGYKICPTGDYSQVKSFGEWCIFGEGCSFGERCRFGEWCRFGEGCSFGERCSFGEWCIFGEGCSFGERCSFGEQCIFGEGCSFGEGCRFGERCEIEQSREFKNFLKFEGFGSTKRCTYFWLLSDNSIYVRCGCFAGDIDEFRQKVIKTHGDSKIAKGYLEIARLAEWYLQEV